MATLLGQQLNEAPRYNHPCGDLLDNGRREEYINICAPLYRASIKADLEAARDILKGREYLVRYSITERKETPLHVIAAVRPLYKAARRRSYKVVRKSRLTFVRYLVDMMSEEDLKLQNEQGNNAFCVAAINGNREMAMIMLQKNRELLRIRGSGNMMPLYLAAYHRNREAVSYLYEHSQRMSSDHGWTDDDRNSVFLRCIEMKNFSGALRILNDREELPQDKYLCNVLHVLAPMADAFRPKVPEQPFWLKRLLACLEILDFKVRIPKKESEAATHLLRKIWKRIVVKTKDEIDEILRGPAEKDTYPSQILFVAAENGNAIFLVELIREYPDVIWKTDDDGQTIFHIGVSHRRPDILKLLFEIASKDTIAQLKDKNGNTLLHSVSKNIGRTAEDEIRGLSFQFLHEVYWYRRVKNMVPPSYEQLKNAAGQTPIEIFDYNHKDLIIKAEEWMKETSNQCMVVATLITTISFSAAFTIPGGYNQTTGFPMFLRNKPFTVFLILDVISFIFSTVSILLFLHSSFSRYCKYNSHSCHLKFAMGFLALLYSILTLMVAFCASFFVLYHNKLPIIISSLATLAAIIFFLMEAKTFTLDVLTITDRWLTPPML